MNHIRLVFGCNSTKKKIRIKTHSTGLSKFWFVCSYNFLIDLTVIQIKHLHFFSFLSCLSLAKWICTSTYFYFLNQLNIMKERKWDNPRQLLLDVITKENICSSLKPLFYNEQSYIVQEGDPIVAIFLITEGTVWSSSSTSRNITGEGTTATSRQVERLVKGQIFGEELLDWFWKKDSSIDMSKLILPVSSKTLKTHTKVEAFALMADDFKEIVSRHHDLDKNQVES